MMPARDIEAQVKAWVADEVQKLSFTDDVGWLLGWTVGNVPRIDTFLRRGHLSSVFVAADRFTA